MDECVVCSVEPDDDHLTQGVCHNCAAQIFQQSNREESVHRCTICFVYDESTEHGKCADCASAGGSSADYFRIMLKLPELLSQMAIVRGIRATIPSEDREEFRRKGNGVALTLENPDVLDEATLFLRSLGLWIELDTGRIVVIPDQPIPKSALIGLAQQSS